MSLSWKIKYEWKIENELKNKVEKLEKMWHFCCEIAVDTKYTDEQFEFALKKHEEKVKKFYEQYPQLKGYKIEDIKMALY